MPGGAVEQQEERQSARRIPIFLVALRCVGTARSSGISPGHMRQELFVPRLSDARAALALGSASPGAVPGHR
jgi:hypothetical protein